MRFLLDQNISPAVATPLRRAGHDVIVAREVGLRAASDTDVIAAARHDGCVLVSADTDFGAILATSGAATPSFLLMRRAANRRPEEQAKLILDNLDTIASDLEAGAVVVRRIHSAYPSLADRGRVLMCGASVASAVKF